jgi:Fur family ferric uptake transcriptional regulator
MSRQRSRRQQAIVDLLQQLNREISAQDLFWELRHRQQHVGLATVYRVLNKLKQDGTVQERVLESGESLYRPNTGSPQHHLNCVRCGRSVKVDSCPVCQGAALTQPPSSFQVFYHTLEFFGICPACREGDDLNPASAQGT